MSPPLSLDFDLDYVFCQFVQVKVLKRADIAQRHLSTELLFPGTEASVPGNTKELFSPVLPLCAVQMQVDPDERRRVVSFTIRWTIYVLTTGTLQFRQSDEKEPVLDTGWRVTNSFGAAFKFVDPS